MPEMILLACRLASFEEGRLHRTAETLEKGSYHVNRLFQLKSDNVTSTKMILTHRTFTKQKTKKTIASARHLIENNKEVARYFSIHFLLTHRSKN